MSLYLVSCVGQKLSVPAPAADLYTSAWFRKARSYVAESGEPWFILSAKYGLVHPDKVIEPYDVTLNTMPVADRREWARSVLGDLEFVRGRYGNRRSLGGQTISTILGRALGR